MKREDQVLFDNWQSALNYKQAVINNHAAYWYVVAIPKTEKIRCVKFLKWVWKTKTTWHNEARFNPAKYIQDQATADLGINRAAEAVNNKINEYRQQLGSAINDKVSERQQLTSLQQEVKSLRQKAGVYHQSHDAIKAKLDQTYVQINFLNQQVNSARHQHQELPAQINQVKNEQKKLEEQIKSEQQQLQILSTKLTQEQKQLFEQMAQIDDQQRAGVMYRSHDTIKAKLDQTYVQIAALKQQISLMQRQYQELPAQINQAKNEQKKLEEQIKSEQQQLQALTAKLTQEQKQLFEQMAQIDDQQRAAVLAGLFGAAEATIVIDIIKTLGFNANHLAYLALESNNIQLFDLALQYEANCTSYAAGGKTLLQMALSANKDSWVSKILDNGTEYGVTLLNAVKQTDLVTIEKLLTHDKNYASKLFHGYNLLQIAISSNNAEVINKILTIDSACINSLTTSGDSSFKIALRSSTDEIIKIIAQKVEIEEELKNFIKANETTVVNKALGVCTISADIVQNLMIFSLNTGAIDIVEKLIEKGGNIDSILQKAIQEQDNSLLLALVEFDINLMDSITEQAETFTTMQDYLAGNITTNLDHL